MNRLALIALFLSPFATAGVFTTEHVQPYPSDWPQLTGMSDTCVEVEGAFVDPNTWRWDREENPGSKYGAKYGGTRQAAWVAFGLSPSDVRPEDKNFRSRVFTISMAPNESLTIGYLIDGKVAASKSFTKDKLSCNKDGLTITVQDYSGAVLDKLPNEGRAIQRSTLYKLNGDLFVKTTNETKARIFQVVPQSFLNVHWFRFQGQNY